MTISLAFLAPDLVKAAVEGRLPRAWSPALRLPGRVVPSKPLAAVSFTQCFSWPLSWKIMSIARRDWTRVYSRALQHKEWTVDKETRPPPRYNEGTLIEAMQNAWRFVDDEVLRERLKEAKGIGTPATRAEIIGGLKKQSFLMAQGKHIVPTETGLSLFGVLKQADPALVDPGVTAQLECLLDDVVVGKQEMVGAIDAVCDVAERIIGKLKDGAAVGGARDRHCDAGGLVRVGGPVEMGSGRIADGIGQAGGLRPDQRLSNVYKLYRATRIGPDSIIKAGSRHSYCE